MMDPSPSHIFINHLDEHLSVLYLFARLFTFEIKWGKQKKKTNNQHYQVSIHAHEQVAHMTESSVTYPIRRSPNSRGICFLK